MPRKSTTYRASVMISPGVAGRNTLNAANEAFTNEVTMKGGQF
jgi:hypothetical protein